MHSFVVRSTFLDVSILDVGMVLVKDVDPDLAIQTRDCSEMLDVSIIVDATT